MFHGNVFLQITRGPIELRRALLLAGLALVSISVLAQQDEAMCPAPGANEFTIALLPDTPKLPMNPLH